MNANYGFRVCLCEPGADASAEVATVGKAAGEAEPRHQSVRRLMRA
jgi:hypothetical protein